MNFSQTFGNGSFASSQPDSLGSDRLRKAIERNRAKQAKRAGNSKVEPQVISRSRASAPRKPEVISSPRKSVARPESFEFASAVRETGVKVPTKTSYQVRSRASVKSKTATTKRKTRVARKKTAATSNKYVLRGLWVLVGILILRLIFSSGGVLDYFSQVEKLERTESRLSMIKNENKALNKEIELIKTDDRYQRKLIRDHLGYISKNEYIVLFSKSR